MGGGVNFPSRGNHRFGWGGFFTRLWEPEEEWFWQFKPFSKLKTAFCSILWILNHDLKSKLAWPVSQKSMKLKQKWYKSNDCSWKWRFYWVLTWKFLFGEGIDFFLWREGDYRWGNEQMFWWEKTNPIPPVGKTLVLFTIEQVQVFLFQFYKMRSYHGQWYSMPKAKST